MSNRLAQETSPYLLQHAENPVDWYPWGAEAIDRARAEDRPILLSIGYSSCHWCHVMEHESFEDPSTAALMNRLFVNIKVDREERPDIDQVYMKAVQAMTGGGGWPMTVFLTPDLVPFFGGTYFPPIPRHGLPSFAQVLQATANAFEVRREQVEEGAAKLAEALARAASGGGGHEVDHEVLDGVYRALENRYDAVHGGFGQAPKFPQSVTIDVLLRHHVREPESDALGMAVHTLRRMAAGGLRDHLAGGFHRYSVDARWLVPHFEKMLYDNALLARCYLDAYRVSGHDDLRGVAVETLDYLVADMRSPEGGFFSARDADSEGEEGTFYVWSADEVSALLGEEEGRLFSRVYDVTQEGNFEGKNILHLPHEIEAIATAEGISEGELRMRLASARSTLLETRSRREPPFRDEKVLASWNGMAVRAFAEAGAALGRQDYVDVATESAEFLWSVLRREGRLLHTHMDGESRINAFLDDHASLGNAFLSLHAANLEGRWLAAARWLCDQILERFWDETEETVYDTAADAENLFMRPRDPMDNATPSGASLTAELFTRAGHIFDDDRLREVAGRIIDYEADALQRYGPAFGRMLSVLDRRLTPPVEVVIAAARGDETATSMVRAAHGGFHPNLTVVGRWEEDDGPTPALLEDRAPLDGQAAAYVCRAYTCRLPVTEVDAMLAELGAIQ